MLKTIKIAVITALLAISPSQVFADDASAMIDKATYSLVATFKVKDGHVDKFIEAMKENTKMSRQEAGVIDYRSYQSPDDPNTFINFEAYTDKAGFDAHLASDHVKAIGPIFDEILASPIEVDFLSNY